MVVNLRQWIVVFVFLAGALSFIFLYKEQLQEACQEKGLRGQVQIATADALETVAEEEPTVKLELEPELRDQLAQEALTAVESENQDDREQQEKLRQQQERLQSTTWLSMETAVGTTATTTSAQAVAKHRPRANNYDLLVVTPSYWSEAERRCAVRDSWRRYMEPDSRCAKCQKYKVHCIFVVGNMVRTDEVEKDKRQEFEEEEKQFGDLFVLPDFAENERYTERSQKTLKSIKFAVDHFNFTMMLKCDTDSYVFLDRLLAALEKEKAFSPDQNLYMGNFQAGAGAKVVTEKTKDKTLAKWVDATYKPLTGLEKYPVHAKGPGYLLSYSMAVYLAQPPIPFKAFTCEDTAIGTYLMSVKYRRVELPVALGDVGCDNAKTSPVIDHYVKPHIMRRRWRRFQILGAACLAPKSLKEDQAELACTSKDPKEKPILIYRYKDKEGKEISGAPLAQLNGTLQTKQHSRGGACKVTFSWRDKPWRDCRRNTIDKSMPQEHWRCVECTGSDGQVYDEWDCPAKDRPTRCKMCEERRNGTVLALPPSMPAGVCAARRLPVAQESAGRLPVGRLPVAQAAREVPNGKVPVKGEDVDYDDRPEKNGHTSSEHEHGGNAWEATESSLLKRLAGAGTRHRSPPRQRP